MSSVELRNVRKTYGALDVIHDVSLDIEDGEFIALVGPSGCGKSTLLRMIAGLEEITDGDVLIGPDIVNGLTPRAQHRHGVPVLCALSAYDGRREHGLQPQACRREQAGDCGPGG